MAALVLAYRPCNRWLQLESRESLVMGASLCRDGRRLPSKCSPVRENPLLRHGTSVPSCGGFRRTVGIRDRGAAPRSVSPCGLRYLLPRAVRRDSARQVPQQPPLTLAQISLGIAVQRRTRSFHLVPL